MSLPIFVNRMKSKEDFSLLQQSWKAKNSFRFVVQQEGPDRPFPGTTVSAYVQLSEISTVSLSMCASS